MIWRYRYSKYYLVFKSLRMKKIRLNMRINLYQDDWNFFWVESYWLSIWMMHMAWFDYDTEFVKIWSQLTQIICNMESERAYYNKKKAKKEKQASTKISNSAQLPHFLCANKAMMLVQIQCNERKMNALLCSALSPLLLCFMHINYSFTQEEEKNKKSKLSILY